MSQYPHNELPLQIHFPESEGPENSTSQNLMSLSIYRALSVPETQSRSHEVMNLDSSAIKIHYTHYKKNISFENNFLICEERSFSGASLRMNYSCQLQVDPKWLVTSFEKNKLTVIGPFAEALYENISSNQNIQCKKNMFTTQCRIQISASQQKQNSSYSVFAQVCPSNQTLYALNLQQLALDKDRQKIIEKNRFDQVSLSILQNKIAAKWRIHNPKLLKEFNLNTSQIQQSLTYEDSDLPLYNAPYYLANPKDCQLVPVLNYDSHHKKFRIQKVVWNNLTDFDRSWILLKSSLQMTLQLDPNDRLVSDQWLFDIIFSQNINESFRDWTEKLHTIGSQILETPFLNSTALISANDFFEFSADQSYIQKGFLTKSQKYFLMNQNITVDQYYNLFTKKTPRELFITSAFSTMIKNKLFDWQPNRRYFFFENGQIESGSVAKNSNNPNLRINSKTLHLQIVGGNYKGCEQSNIQLSSDGQILSVCGVTGSVFWKGEWLEIAKEYPIDLKNEKELLCGTSKKTLLYPINPYSFEPLPSYFIPPCGGL